MSRRAGRWAAVALAALLCGLSAWTYARSAGDDTRAYARERDAALDAGRAHVARLSSWDASRPGTVRAGWLDATAGDLHERLRKTGQREDTATATTRATVTDAALTALDDRAGTAGLIATVRVETAPGGGKAGGGKPDAGRPADTDRKRLEAALVRTGDGWKVTALTAVPVAGP
ncbi:hypothetical protein [Streptomyces ficellus]|uniref:Mce-associated membrane protein n=1 Tax=Streptomyces ficellus TaxID=1977088 RepID=A0A6I6F4D6_9ACTN|nr:hypothetical protein [Streptomyces ficellus]QGV77624.1 hypothetical protein EIZ62_04710 [Streptomyces ficellus]